jgi:hypothetical protein
VDEGASPRILLAAITSVLLQALADEETAHYADEALRSDLLDLLSRVEHDLDRIEGRSHLRPVEDCGDA